MKKFVSALLLAVAIVWLSCCGGDTAPKAPAISARPSASRSQNESAPPQSEAEEGSSPEDTMPEYKLPESFDLSEYVYACFDKDGMGDCGYITRLNDNETADILSFIDTESLTPLKKPIEHGLNNLLTLKSEDFDKTLIFFGGTEDYGTVIMTEENGNKNIFTASSDIAEKASALRPVLKDRAHEIYNTYIRPIQESALGINEWNSFEDSGRWIWLFEDIYMSENDMESPFDKYGSDWPVDDMAALLSKYFDGVDRQKLISSMKNYYNADTNTIYYEGHRSSAPQSFHMRGIEINDDVLSLTYAVYSFIDDTYKDEKFILSVKMTEDGGFKYLSNKITAE